MSTSSTMMSERPRTREAPPARAVNHPALKVNVGKAERAGSAVLGGTLLTIGLARRSMGGLAAVVAGGGFLYRAVTGHCYLYEQLGLDTAGSSSGVAGAPDSDAEAVGSITIGKSAEELERLWRDPETLARIVGNFAEVTPEGEGRHHWKLRAPLGRTLEWDSRTVEDAAGHGLRWESLEGAELPNEGEVRFRPAPAGRGTEATLRIRFDPPGGAIGGVVTKLLGFVPRLMASRTLHYFKSLAETGEIPTTDRQPAARVDPR